MSSKKYYAVRKGKKTGIYNNWELCKKQIQGFSGAEYKGFLSYSEAEVYMNQNTLSNVLAENDEISMNIIESNNIDVYIDGSYSDEMGLFSYSCVILDKNETILSGVSSDESDLSMRNVAGELLASMEAIKWAANNKYSQINIFYDYEGIEKWANGAWKANKEGTKKYVNFINQYKKIISIAFTKVKAHTGNKYNEIADKIAKEAFLKHFSSMNHQDTNPINDTLMYLDLFKKVISKKERSKNTFVFVIDNYNISESKLKKLATELWATSGKDVKQIATINTQILVSEREIIYEIKDNFNSSNTYIIKF